MRAGLRRLCIATNGIPQKLRGVTAQLLLDGYCSAEAFRLILERADIYRSIVNQRSLSSDSVESYFAVCHSYMGWMPDVKRTLEVAKSK